MKKQILTIKQVKAISNLWFIIPSILLAGYLIFRISDYSKLLSIFPLSANNDIPDYMSILVFLFRYGYNAFVQNWYNGFRLFEFIQPGWYFFALPLYILTKDILVTSFISILLMLFLGFLFLLLIGKFEGLSLVKKLLFSLLFFANAISIAEFLSLGRVSEMFGWIAFLSLAAVVFYYKDKAIDKKFFVLFTLSYFIVILSHFSETVLSHFLIASLFLVKDWKERRSILICSLVSLVLSSFWWIPFLSGVYRTHIVNYGGGNRLLMFNKEWMWSNIAAFVIPLFFLLISYLYLNERKSRKEALFFLPEIILAFLLFFRLVVFIPILRFVFPYPYCIFFIFFLSLLFLKIERPNNLIRKVIIISLVILPILSIAISAYHTHFFNVPEELETNTLSVLSSVKEKFLILESPSHSSYPEAYYAYGAIYYNLSTPAGFYDIVTSLDYLEKIYQPNVYLKNKDCQGIIKSMDLLNATEIITYNEHCDTLSNCGFDLRATKNNVCLYNLLG